MIKINLLAEKKQQRAKTPALAARTGGGAGTGQNLILVGLLLMGVAVAGTWWWMLEDERQEWVQKNTEADAELKRLEAIRAKGEQYEAQKQLLAKKIELITDLKAKQVVPVYILDQVSKNLPEFLWLESMQANDHNVSIVGKATTYTAVSNFYENLKMSGYFQNVDLGRTYEVPEGVAFSLSALFVQPGDQSRRAEG
jgi:Tfp pilus assembly protein PilN